MYNPPPPQTVVVALSKYDSALSPLSSPGPPSWHRGPPPGRCNEQTIPSFPSTVFTAGYKKEEKTESAGQYLHCHVPFNSVEMQCNAMIVSCHVMCAFVATCPTQGMCCQFGCVSPMMLFFAHGVQCTPLSPCNVRRPAEKDMYLTKFPFEIWAAPSHTFHSATAAARSADPGCPDQPSDLRRFLISASPER